MNPPVPSRQQLKENILMLKAQLAAREAAAATAAYYCLPAVLLSAQI
jgi:hypothetical protein